jgi:hypothetical protein
VRPRSISGRNLFFTQTTASILIGFGLGFSPPHIRRRSRKIVPVYERDAKAEHPRLHRRPPQHDVLRNEGIDAERGTATRVFVDNNRNQNGETLSPPSLLRRSYPQRMHNAAGLKTITEYERSGNDPAQMRSDRSGCLLLTPSEAGPRPRLQLSTTRGLQSGKPERREAAIFTSAPNKNADRPAQDRSAGAVDSRKGGLTSRHT